MSIERIVLVLFKIVGIIVVNILKGLKNKVKGICKVRFLIKIYKMIEKRVWKDKLLSRDIL